MTREVPTAEVFAAVVPEEVDPSDLAQRGDLIKMLSAMAYRYVYRNWQGARVTPAAIRNMTSEWCITSDPQDVEKFQPVHDCAACAAGNEQAMAFLRDNPGRWVALANVCYTEVWHV